MEELIYSLQILFLTILLIFIFFRYKVLNKIIYSMQYKNENGETVFYPNGIEVGYIATEEQIEKCVKSYSKIKFFNQKRYKKDIEEIFKDSKIVEKKLPFDIYRKNIIKNTSWSEMIFWCIFYVLFIIQMYNNKLEFYFGIFLGCFCIIYFVIHKIIHK